jgi:DNA-binding MarR family transcriptional regulator
MRAQFFDEHLFADPAWDILLELYALECEGRRVSVSKLSVAAGVPCTTTLRWSDKLEADGLVVRFDDPVDGRRVWIELSERGLKTMKSYVEHVAGGGNLA